MPDEKNAIITNYPAPGQACKTEGAVTMLRVSQNCPGGNERTTSLGKHDRSPGTKAKVMKVVLSRFFSKSHTYSTMWQSDSWIYVEGTAKTIVTAANARRMLPPHKSKLSPQRLKDSHAVTAQKEMGGSEEQNRGRSQRMCRFKNLGYKRHFKPKGYTIDQHVILVVCCGIKIMLWFLLKTIHKTKFKMNWNCSACL